MYIDFSGKFLMEERENICRVAMQILKRKCLEENIDLYKKKVVITIEDETDQKKLDWNLPNLDRLNYISQKGNMSRETNDVYNQLMWVIHKTVDPYLEGHGGSQVPKLAYAIFSAFDVVPIDKYPIVSTIQKKHKPCSCGSQFKLEKIEFTDLNVSCKNGWFLICENLGGCCEVVSIFIEGKTPNEIWSRWDQGY